MRRLKIPQYAKTEAKKALKVRRQLPKSKRFGLNQAEASRLGINSGVERAKQIINNNTISEKDARRIKAFYKRFRSKRGMRAEGAISLWGGRRWGRELSKKLNK